MCKRKPYNRDEEKKAYEDEIEQLLLDFDDEEDEDIHTPDRDKETR